MIKVDGMEVTVRGKTSKILSNLEMLGMAMRQVEAPKGALLDAFITGLYGDAGNKVDSARVIYGEVKIGDPDTTTKGAARKLSKRQRRLSGTQRRETDGRIICAHGPADVPRAEPFQLRETAWRRTSLFAR